MPSCVMRFCRNYTGKTSKSKKGITYHSFPLNKFRRLKWVEIVRKQRNQDDWLPNNSSKICSIHFNNDDKHKSSKGLILLNKSALPVLETSHSSPPAKSCSKCVLNDINCLKMSTASATVPKTTHSLHASACSEVKNPDLKSSNLLKSSAFPVIEVAAKCNSFMKQRIGDEQLITKYEQFSNDETVTDVKCKIELTMMADKGCQTDIYSQYELKQTETTFICNRYVQNNYCDAETQVEIPTTSRIVTIIPLKIEEGCTYTVTYSDESTPTSSQGFFGISSVKNDQQLQDIAGVSFEIFKFLLKRMPIWKCEVSKEDQLLIFLMKFKTGLTFSALSVLFGIHRMTISQIFYHALQDLTLETADFVFWPNKATVQATMPDCFHPEYSDTRVIIDCTEFRIEEPDAVEDRLACYSHYNRGFTVKGVIGITPGGFVCFKSKVVGGRNTDAQMTIESGLIDKLENGDLVLADKDFPEIKKVIDTSGKDIKVVSMPLFLKIKNEFIKEEPQETQDITQIRIHVERIMQSLRVYRILDKIPLNLYDCIDNILHMCCVLVNLQQPSIFANKYVDLENELS